VVDAEKDGASPRPKLLVGRPTREVDRLTGIRHEPAIDKRNQDAVYLCLLRGDRRDVLCIAPAGQPDTSAAVGFLYAHPRRHRRDDRTQLFFALWLTIMGVNVREWPIASD
jgi:hypothetical protein